MNDLDKITITHVKSFGPFLQIYGHKQPELLRELTEHIAAYVLESRQAISEKDATHWEFNTIYLALSSETKTYHRCVLLDKVQNGRASIELIDYGHTFQISTDNLYVLDKQFKRAIFLGEFPPISNKYILSKFSCNWKNKELDIISDLLQKSILSVFNEDSDGEHLYLSLLLSDGTDVLNKLTENGIGCEISPIEQKTHVRSLSKHLSKECNSSKKFGRHLVPNRPLQSINNNNNNTTINSLGKKMIQNHLATNTVSAQRIEPVNSRSEYSMSTPAFIALDISIGPYHTVYCSYVEDGPNLFSVQLKNQEHILDRMSNELTNFELNNITTRLSIGMAVVARFSEDRALYRAAIQNIKSDGCHVTFIDFGNSEFVLFADLYQIPERFLEHKTFSIPFKLFGCDQLQPMTNDIKQYFTELVQHAENGLDMRVVSSDNSAIQSCELYLKSENVLHILKVKINELSSYPKAKQLLDRDEVIISYARTAQQFFVQRVKDMPEVDLMMDLLFASSEKMPPLKELPSNGECCAVKSGNSWYRAVVLNKIETDRVLVKLVDYGIESPCYLHQVKTLPNKFLQLPMQAIECCLVDFVKVQNVSETTGKQLDMIAERGNSDRTVFRMYLHGHLPNSHVYIVDLKDESKSPALNVSSSIYKNVMPRRTCGTKILPYITTCDEHFPPIQLESPIGTENQSNRNVQNDLLKNPKVNYEAESRTSNEPQKLQLKQKPDSLKYADRAVIEPKNSSKGELQSTYKSVTGANNVAKHSNEPYNQIDDNANYVADSKEREPEPEAKNGVKSLTAVTNIPSVDATQTQAQIFGINFPIESLSVPTNSVSHVNLVTWKSPFEFYVHLKSMEIELDEMMGKIQKFYRSRKPIKSKPPIGAFVIARKSADNDMKRAKIIDYNEHKEKYRVQFIDYGTKSTCSLCDLFEIEHSFTLLPAIAIKCSLKNVVLNKSVTEIMNKIHLYIGKGDEKIECHFDDAKSAEGKVFPKTIVNGRDLSDSMIQDGFLNRLPKDINLDYLVGETLWMKVNAVTDLLSFQGQIHGCDTVFMCSYKDKSIAKSTNGQSLSERFRTFEQQFVKVKIERISAENVLMLTIYLPFLDGDYSTIPSYPIYVHQFNGSISYTAAPHKIYVQNKQYSEELAALLDDMYEYYEKNGLVCDSPQIGELYAALSSDGNWYRGRVVQIDRNASTVEMCWIDYGNNECVPNNQVKPLESKFKEAISAFVQEMYLPIKPKHDDNTSIINLINDYGEENELTIKITGIHKSHYYCDLINANGASLLETLTNKHLIQPIEQFEEDFDETQKEKIEFTVNSDMITAFVSHCDHPNRFYLQLDSDTDALNELQENLQIVAPSLPLLTKLHSDSMCVVKYTLDDQWYRAKIIDTDGEVTSIQFIDYGNTDSITDNKLLKASNESITERKPYALACSLAIEPHKEWCDNGCIRFRNAISDFENPLQFSYISKDENINYVDLFVDGQNIAELLVNENLAEPCEVINMNEKCFVSHINSLDDFFIQIESQSETLQLVEEFLNSESGNIESDGAAMSIDCLNVGSTCSAQFEDGRYYRAKVLDNQNNGNGIEVEFMDYGNVTRSHQIRPLHAKISEMQPLCKRCSLRTPTNVKCWSEEAEEKFRELSADGDTEFVAHLIGCAKKKTVIDLMMDGELLSKKLSHLCETHVENRETTTIHPSAVTLPIGKQQCFVSHTNSASDFYVQVATSDVDAMKANLENANDFELFEEVEVGTLCAAMFEDDCYYRAKILEKVDNGYMVLFIDSGKTANSKDLRQLPEALKTIAPIAIRCKLEDDLIENLKTQTENSENIFHNQTFQEIEFLDNSTEPVTVRFFENGNEHTADGPKLTSNNGASNAADVADVMLTNIIAESIVDLSK